MSRIVAVSQRIDEWPERGERRDALDQRFSQWLTHAALIPVPVPNGLSAPDLDAWLDRLRPDGIVLSGGNHVGAAPDRDETESALLRFAAAGRRPLLGVCRGMQMMAIHAGGVVVPLTDHVGTRHRLSVEGAGAWPNEVNSFHNLGLTVCAPGYAVAARAEDGSIEAMTHLDLPWEAWMWHPEREGAFSVQDLGRLANLFGSAPTP